MVAFGAVQAGFSRRAVKLGGAPSDPAVRAHVEHSIALGFDTLWVYAPQAGAWTERRAPEGPRLDPAFVDLARWCRERGVGILVSINPVAEDPGAFRFADRDARRRLHRFVRLLRRQAGVVDVVLSFDDQPTVLSEINDILRFGRSAAPAHVDLARRFERWVPRRGTVWLCAAAYADVHLGDGTGPYSREFLDRLDTLPGRVGIVWTGPEVVSRSISRDDLRATRARLGNRRVLLYDNFPVNGDSRGEALGLVLGPLRQRAPDLSEEADLYLACPMAQLGASRLPLATVADWLRDPGGYDPDASWQAAQDRLAGDDPDARAALRVQALEWGGWVGTRNYVPAWVSNVDEAARGLREPAYVASWTWTARRYPERMRALAGLVDGPFRDDLLTAMERRLTVALAIPLVVEFRARAAAGRADAADVLEQIRVLRDRPSTGADARRALVAFLEAAGVPVAPR